MSDAESRPQPRVADAERPVRGFAHHFLVFFLPWAIAAAAAALLIHHYESTAAAQRLRARETAALDAAARAIRHEIQELTADLLVRAADSALLALLDSPSADARRQLEEEWARDIDLTNRYDRIGYVSPQGEPLARADSHSSQSVAGVSASPADGETMRDVAEVMRLERGQVSAASLELRTREGHAETPLTPILRLATPAYDRHGARRGALFIHYSAAELFAEIDEVTQGAGTRVMLLNSDGWWLKANEPDDEWGFAIPGRGRFSDRHASEWNRMLAEDAGQFETATGLWTHRRLSPLGTLQPAAAGAAQQAASPQPGKAWILASRVEIEDLERMRSGLRARLAAGCALLLAMVAGMSLPLARSAVRQQQAEREVRRVNRDLEALVDQRTRALRESEARFASLVANAPLFVAIADRQGRLQFLNRVRPGFDASSVIGTSIYEYIDASSHPAVHEALDEVFRTGEPRRLQVLAAGEHGTQTWYETHYGPVIEGDQVVAVALMSEDISARLQAERALRASETKYRALFEDAMDAIFVADSVTGMLVDANRRALELTGRSLEELTQLHFTALHPPEDAAVARTEFTRARAHPGRSLLRLPLLHRDGQRIPVEIASSAVTGADGRSLTFGVFRDVSEREKAEDRIRQLNADLEQRVEERTRELETAMKELESFSYSVSHDLRTPLRAIEGFSALLETDHAPMLDGEGRDHLQRIRRAAHRMAELIDDLLDLARLVRAELRRKELDLSAMAAAIVDELRARDPERQVEVIVGEGIRGSGDAVLVRAVLTNLIDNAWKFTSRKAQARIEFGCSPTNGTTAYFVRDNGAGFDMAFSGKLFGPFQRLHGPAEFEGTGIGLATVQRIVQRHGGKVWAEGAVDVGATIWFTLEGGSNGHD